MGYTRFGARLFLLILLLFAAISAFLAKGAVMLLLWLAACVVLAAAIYAVGFWQGKSVGDAIARAREDEAGVRLWSPETPFMPTGPLDPLVVQYPILAPFYPALMPGAHILAARLVPMLAGLLPAGVVWLLKVTAWEVVAPVAFVVTCFVVYMVFVRLVSARCMADGCGGRAYLHNEIMPAPSQWSEGDLRRYVYICRSHGHRRSTGINCFGWCPDGGHHQKSRAGSLP